MPTRATDPFALHCLELLSPLGRPHARAMFGGVGLYVDELFIALLADDRLYLKTNPHTQGAFEAAGCEPFRYTMKDGREMTMGYWTAPEAALDSPEAMRPWARRAMEAALVAANAKPAKRKKKQAAEAGR